MGQNDELLHLASLLKTAVVKCVHEAKAIAPAKNITITSQTEPPARGRHT